MRDQKIKKPVRILMVAINGYGHYYLKSLLEEVAEEDAALTGIVDPEAEKSGYISWINKKDIPVFRSVEAYFGAGNEADLTVISSPPQFHTSQAITALENGSNVLVDKPVGVLIESVEQLIAKAEECNRWVEVGYQWSFSSAIRNLKRDIISGVYGKPVLYKTICLWPRPFEYYKRNSWAGKIEDPNGHMVLDSPANNACAHFLHNLLFLLGDKINSSALPVKVEGERYRAYDIDNFDTVSLIVETSKGEKVLFYASHVTESERNPEFILEFEKGRVEFVWGGNIEGILPDGSGKQYGSPEDESQFKKLHDSIIKVRERGESICPPEAAIAQTKCINMLHETCDQIIKFQDNIVVESEKGLWVKGLSKRIETAYKSGRMINFNKL